MYKHVCVCRVSMYACTHLDKGLIDGLCQHKRPILRQKRPISWQKRPIIPGQRADRWSLPTRLFSSFPGLLKSTLSDTASSCSSCQRKNDQKKKQRAVETIKKCMHALLSMLYACVPTHTYIYACTHAHRVWLTYVCLHIHTYTHVHMRTEYGLRMCAYTYIHIRIYTYIHV